MPVSRNHGRWAGAFAWVRSQILNWPALALSSSIASRALRRAGGAGDGLESVDKGFPPNKNSSLTTVGGEARDRSLHLAPLAGRGRRALARRVRGPLRESELVERPPHPDPLPASGG